MNKILVEVSVGELFDKISILEIKVRDSFGFFSATLIAKVKPEIPVPITRISLTIINSI